MAKPVVAETGGSLLVGHPARSKPRRLARDGDDVDQKADHAVCDDRSRGQADDARRPEPDGKDRELHGRGDPDHVAPSGVVRGRETRRRADHGGNTEARKWPLEILEAYRPSLSSATTSPAE